MTQLTNKIFCDEHIASLKYDNLILSSPYAEYPYLIIKDFISQELCEEIYLHVKNSNDAKEAKLISNAKSKNSAIRKTDIYTLSPTQHALYEEALSLHVKKIEAFYNVALSSSTKPQLLAYEVGGYYKKHADDSSELVDKQGVTIGFKQVAPQRKITTLLFVNSDFKGGELKFNYLYDEHKQGITFSPSAGDLVVFASNPIFSHEVLEVKSGLRVSIAQWHNT